MLADLAVARMMTITGPAYTAQDVCTCAHLELMVPTAQQSSSHSQLAAMPMPF